ncbi:MAG: hypothetical protein ACRD15_14335 [Vicinamibacterales bacterium]
MRNPAKKQPHRLVAHLQLVIEPMGIALRWREEPFDCEFLGTAGRGTLRVYADGELVCEERVDSATAAHDRAREVKDELLSPRARHA